MLYRALPAPYPAVDGEILFLFLLQHGRYEMTGREQVGARGLASGPWTKIAVWAAGGLLVACTGGTGSSEDCEQLTVSLCAERLDCSPMLARAAPAGCEGSGAEATPVAQGCRSNELDCAAVLQCASRPSDGALWIFPTSCLPPGWSAEPYEACCDDEPGPVGCAALDEAACEAAAECTPLHAQPAGPLCAGEDPPAAFAGCAPVQACGDALTCGVDLATGDRRVYSNTCLPDGWRAIDDVACCLGDPTESWLSCEDASDCVIVEMACCDTCNGGWRLSLHTDFEGAARAALQDTECGGVSCTEIGCPPDGPTCEAGVCGIAPLEPGPDCGTLDEAGCDAAPECAPMNAQPAAAWCDNDFVGWEFQACQDAGVSCPGVETCALRDADGARVVFPSGCVPPGFTAISTEACCEETLTEIPDAWRACGGDDECVAVEMECCDVCNGGRQESVNAAFSGQVAAQFAEQRCDGVICTGLACVPPPPQCLAGQCGFGDRPAPERCAGLDPTACEADPECVVISGQLAPGVCEGESESTALGCMAAITGCGDMPTCGEDPASGQLAQFADTCLPDGWQPVAAGCCPAPLTCEEGQSVPVAQLCVRGEMHGGGETLSAAAPPSFQVTPEGCWSSSCTIVYEASCAATASNGQVHIEALFCLGPTEDDVCTPDCNGGGFADCATASLPEGAYTAHLGDIEVPFTVPSELPFGGVCAGSPF